MGADGYDCDGSGAEVSGVSSVFSGMGYASGGTYADYSYYAVKNEVFGGNPVILRGGRNSGWWIFGVYSDGHAWVCDGLYDETYYSCQPDPNTPGEQISVHWGENGFLNMNWGWGGSHNGYYSSSNFNPGSNTFNYRTKMITGIRRP